ncbi:hypothetical protein L226DRAFT_564447 [Lentinus tigrinus ALCF2SS1-7]|uniref:Copper acquisition factor BIM1-like domain-containing protein n=1 Tax=Lentinus tigrinus ALCF2SS1-6 TaxID=1328759 RepID=A0A5C2SIP3_9APHY|nr:hypothetical protein L227DRAFT_609056 [Lentinus tigrinus ALCF2SS1-6]RPD81785.1 hypothetical protein L226DRAFT_564447 [Lentinus tigrinus ALCF2SS1-7]
MFMAGLMTVVSAHFQLQYPPPRGDFVEDDEPTFCDGYVNSVSNRTTFPTSGGFISINSEHPSWTLGGILASVQNPTNFTQFEDSNGNFQMFLPFFQTTGEGVYCVDVDLASSGISGIKSGANVTLQFVFDGGDGQLYQCADVTLADNFTIPTSISCKNATDAAATPVSTSVAATGTSPSSSSSGSAPSSTTTNNAAVRNAVMGVSGVAGLLGAIVALL